jgi:hypothetical protein
MHCRRTVSYGFRSVAICRTTANRLVQGRWHQAEPDVPDQVDAVY